MILCFKIYVKIIIILMMAAIWEKNTSILWKEMIIEWEWFHNIKSVLLMGSIIFSSSLLSICGAQAEHRAWLIQRGCCGYLLCFIVYLVTSLCMRGIHSVLLSVPLVMLMYWHLYLLKIYSSSSREVLLWSLIYFSNLHKRSTAAV